MGLSTFIRENEEIILREWAEFAKNLDTSSERMTTDALRDHARGMLRFVADYLDKPQSREQAQRSWRAVSPRSRGDTAAAAHGGDRMEWGFSVTDMAAEFRGLRATVMRLWGNATERMDPEELLRFNEAIDRELTESMDRFVKETEREARMLEAMLEHSPDHSYVFDCSGRILYANRAFAEAYGKHPAEVIGQPVEALDNTLAREVRGQIAQVLETGHEHHADFTATDPNGKVRVVEYLYAPMLDEAGAINAIAGTSRDITERKAWERTLWKHANHDHLTGVPNRRLFLDRLDQDIRLARRNGGLLALLYVDLDRFKAANDRLGHDGGDLLLKETTERIAHCIRETDTVARLGGDEFGVVLVDAGDDNHVAAVARAILTRLSRPYWIDGNQARIAASIGIALYPDHGESVDELLHNADQAMYAAKNAGGDALRFHGSEQRQNPRPILHQGTRPTH